MSDQFEEKLDELTGAIVTGFEMVGRRFDEVGKRFDQVDARFVKLENKTDYIKNELGKKSLEHGDRLHALEKEVL